MTLHVVHAVAFSRLSAVDHHVVEQIIVPGALPDLRMHDQSGFKSDHLKRGRRTGGLQQLIVSRHHIVVPNVTNVAFQFCTQRTVIPETVLPAVDLRVLKNESSAFAKGDDLVHRTGHETNTSFKSTNKRRQITRKVTVTVRRIVEASPHCAKESP